MNINLSKKVAFEMIFAYINRTTTPISREILMMILDNMQDYEIEAFCTDLVNKIKEE